MYEDCLDGQPDDTDVQPDTPVLHIPDVALHAPLHLPELLRLPTEARHLCPARHARLHEVSHHILVYQLRVHLRMRQHVRSRTDNRHIPPQHVPELRQLVDVRLSHEVAEGIFPRVVLRRLQPVRVLVHVHRAELIAVEVPSVQSRAQLFEEDRPRTLYLYNKVDDGEQQRREAQERHRQHDVERPLQRLVHRVLQRVLIRRIDFHVVQELPLQVQAYRLHRYRHVVEPHDAMVTQPRHLPDGVPLLP